MRARVREECIDDPVRDIVDESSIEQRRGGADKTSAQDGGRRSAMRRRRRHGHGAVREGGTEVG